MRGTMFKLTNGTEYRLFWVLPNGKAQEYTNTGRKDEEVLFNPLYHSLKQDGWTVKII